MILLLLCASGRTLAQAATAPKASAAHAPAADKSWIAISNKYADELIQVSFKHHPEAASVQGLREFDIKASQPTLADERKERQENEAVVALGAGGSREVHVPTQR
jgi:hypothetical protein